jgi:gamma-glutamyltranspeptidase / glutathione hydrolase
MSELAGLSDLDIRYESRRSPVYARNGIVSTTQPLAAQAGLQVLRAGGNAADAAVATAAALAVVEPTGTGIGGDCFALFYDASTKEVHAVNGSGRAPAGLSLEALSEAGFVGETLGQGVHAATVPGAVAGWADTVARHGRLTLAEVLQGAIALAEDGFPVSPIISYLWEQEAPKARSASPNGDELLIDGRAPRPGEIWRNAGLASVLREIAEGGPAVYYEGRASREIVRALQAQGGFMAASDLAGHCSTFEPPVSTTFRGHTVYECPPNGQGLTALIALNIIEGLDLEGMPRRSPERLHALIEAVRLAFFQARAHLADPAHSEVPVDWLLSDGHASELRSWMDEGARVELAENIPLEVGTDTVYLSVVDGDGNACSFINSNYNGFGTGIIPEGCGFPLQNRGAGFSLDPTHPNALAPGKRPYHTIIPAMSTDPDGELHASFGVMGGWMQPQGHMQVLVSMLVDGLDPQAAMDEPRFCIRANPPHGPVSLEEGIPLETMSALAALGHEVAPVSGIRRSPVFGRGQIIVREPETGVLIGGSDPRGDGAAVGY